jgi:hypothetical protein
MGKLSLATRTFLISFLPLCLVMTFIFSGLNVVLKDKIRDGLRDYVHTSEVLLDRANESEAARTRQVASLLTESAALKASIQLLHETRDRAGLRAQAQRSKNNYRTFTALSVTRSWRFPIRRIEPSQLLNCAAAG